MYADQTERSFYLAQLYFDPLSLTFERDGECLSLPPKVMLIIQYLALNNDRAVSYGELIEYAWEGVEASQASLYQQMALVRKFLQEDKRQPRFIKTLPRQGYRIIAPVSFQEPGVEHLCDSTLTQPTHFIHSHIQPSHIQHGHCQNSHIQNNQPGGEALGQPLLRSQAWFLGTSAAASVILSVLAFQFLLGGAISEPGNYCQPLSGQVNRPTQAGFSQALVNTPALSRIAVPVFYGVGTGKYRGLENALADIFRQQSMDSLRERIALIPVYHSSSDLLLNHTLGHAGLAGNGYERIKAQLTGSLSIAYILEPTFSQSERGLNIGFDLISVKDRQLMHRFQVPIQVPIKPQSTEKTQSEAFKILERELLLAIARV